MARERRPKREYTRGQRALRVLLVILLVALMVLAAFSQYLGQTYLPENVMVSIIAPIQGVFARAAEGINSYVARLKLRSNIEYEYNRIKAQNDQLLYDSLLVAELEDKVKRLEETMNVYQENISWEPVKASVIASEPGNWFSTFTLDKGSIHGIKPQMAVVTTSGMIGSVYEVYADSCKVVTIIDSTSKIAGIIESSRDQGILQGTLGIDGQAMCRMYYLDFNSVPRPGDTVLTSGVGSPFPKGLPLGKIRESNRALDENKYYIVVEPVADFKHIEEVVILRYQPEVQALPDSGDDMGRDIEHPPTPRPTTVIDDQQLEATPAPLPGRPGISDATSTVGPGQTPTPPPGGTAAPASSGEEGNGTGDDEDSEEARRLREEFLQN